MKRTRHTPLLDVVPFGEALQHFLERLDGPLRRCDNMLPSFMAAQDLLEYPERCGIAYTLAELRSLLEHKLQSDARIVLRVWVEADGLVNRVHDWVTFAFGAVLDTEWPLWPYERPADRSRIYTGWCSLSNVFFEPATLADALFHVFDLLQTCLFDNVYHADETTQLGWYEPHRPADTWCQLTSLRAQVVWREPSAVRRVAPGVVSMQFEQNAHTWSDMGDAAVGALERRIATREHRLWSYQNRRRHRRRTTSEL